MSITDLLVIVASLTGLGGLFSLLVNVGKYLHWVEDGNAEVVYTGLTILGLGIVWIVQFFIPTFFPNVPFVNLTQLDAILGSIVKVGSAILEFLIATKAGGLFYGQVRGIVPVLGYSLTLNKKKK